jgi:hypothetical protein
MKHLNAALDIFLESPTGFVSREEMYAGLKGRELQVRKNAIKSLISRSNIKPLGDGWAVLSRDFAPSTSTATCVAKEPAYKFISGRFRTPAVRSPINNSQ